MGRQESMVPRGTDRRVLRGEPGLYRSGQQRPEVAVQDVGVREHRLEHVRVGNWRRAGRADMQAAWGAVVGD